MPAQRSSRPRAQSSASSDADHIPRPPNPFILYRSDMMKTIKATEPSAREVSRLAGQKWKAEPREVKEEYKLKALLLLAEHRRKYPDYRYQPRPRSTKRTRPRRITAAHKAKADNIEGLPASSYAEAKRDPSACCEDGVHESQFYGMADGETDDGDLLSDQESEAEDDDNWMLDDQVIRQYPVAIFQFV